MVAMSQMTCSMFQVRLPDQQIWQAEDRPGPATSFLWQSFLQPRSFAHSPQRTCCRLHIRDSSLLLGHCKAFPIAVGIVHLLIVLVGLVVELQVQLALVALTGKAGLQGQSR